jgi:glycosyltransferase involved in cell wall biosynthesis
MSGGNKLLKSSVIIPTYNRPHELINCIDSILKQTVKPDELIVVDDGDLSELPLEKECIDEGIRYLYIKKKKKGLTESRNEGIKASSGDIIFFFDDDVVLYSEYLEEILNIYNEDTEEVIGGAGGIVTNYKTLTFKNRLRRIFDIFFLISGFYEGKVLPSGFCTDFGITGIPIQQILEVDFLHGCDMSFRKKIFNELTFTDEYRTYGLGEDKDFSYQVSRKFKLIINPGARLLHIKSPEMRPQKKREGRMFVMGRYMFFTKYVKRGWWSWLFFFYAVFGFTLSRIISLIFLPNHYKIDYIKGIFSAIGDILKQVR